MEFFAELERVQKHAALAKCDRRLTPALRRAYRRLELDAIAAHGNKGAADHVLQEATQLIIRTPKLLTPYRALRGEEPFPSEAPSTAPALEHVGVPRSGHRASHESRGPPPAEGESEPDPEPEHVPVLGSPVVSLAAEAALSKHLDRISSLS
jgi:hypothetical protein